MRHVVVLIALLGVCGCGLSTSGSPGDAGEDHAHDAVDVADEAGPGCGNGVVESGEECDDGNMAAGDGCSPTCTFEHACGDGFVDHDEECDDGNTADGDGCSALCRVECVPDCDGRECGDDGCGGGCGPGCGDGEVCMVARGECVTAGGWVEVPSTWPRTEQGHAMAYDSARGVVVLFGGSCAGDPLANTVADTWEYDGTSWRRIVTPTSPPATSGSAMAYDSARGVVVLFGGIDAGVVSRDTWEYDGTTWTEISTPTSPFGRWQSAMTYDSRRGVVVLFGGLQGGAPLSDTWEYDGTTWTEVRPPRFPASRGDHALAYDSARGVVVLFGGSGLTDTWEYDGTTWREVTTATSPPGGGMAYDSARGVAVLVGGGGETWEYDGTTWTDVSLPVVPRGGGTTVYDSARGVVVLFGTAVLFGGGETWEYDGTSWTKVGRSEPRRALVSAGSPDAVSADSADCAMAYDSARDVAVLFQGGGGSDVEAGTTWQYDGTSWAEVATPTSPAARLGPAMAYDASRGVIVLFGGSRQPAGGEEFADTWEFDGLSWTEVATPSAPPGRGKHAMAYDAARGVVVLFGGGVGGAPEGLLDDTWEYDGTTWTEVHPPTSPSARGHHAMAYDSAREVTVLFGGGGSPPYTTHGPPPGWDPTAADTWEYDGTTWTDVSPPTSPSSRGALAMAYDAGRSVVVLFGGVHVGMSSEEKINLHPYLLGTMTWEYDGASWTEINSVVTPPAQLGHVMVYDAARGAIVLLGSYGPDGRASPTWEYYGP